MYSVTPFSMQFSQEFMLMITLEADTLLKLKTLRNVFKKEVCCEVCVGAFVEGEFTPKVCHKMT